ncbi:IS3 family transposase [Micromonospora zamorensis]|uniref:IS3 family transposase n=1 Tax=Micromonospora zamorensis TaxID=709883 RepID=UPI003D9670B3
MAGGVLAARLARRLHAAGPPAHAGTGLVNRQFTATGPNRLWVADATRIPCGQGVFWLAAVRDVFSRRIVGWKTSDRCDTDLILAALEYGIWSRDVRDGQLIHHSDRGSNYTSFRFAQRLQDNGILPSMGSVGDSYDNALMENFWSTLKIELVYRTSWRTRDEAENAIFAYIDGWYNTRRIQKELGDLSPDEYETTWHHQQTSMTEPDSVTPAPTGSR